MTGDPVRVLVADDEMLVRGAFSALIDAAPGLSVVGEAGTGHAAVELALRERPDVVLMDIRMPELDGISATRQITAVADSVRVVVLTTFDLDEYVYSALRAGASGFLLKDMPPAELLAAVRLVASGDALLSPRVTRRVIETFARRAEPAQRPIESLSGITERETEVLELVGRGLSNGEIAGCLHVTVATAKTHVGRLLAKLGARDRAQLVIVAYQSGLITPD